MKSGLVGSVWVFLLIVFTKDLFANKDKMPVTFSFPEYQYKETPKNVCSVN